MISRSVFSTSQASSQKLPILAATGSLAVLLWLAWLGKNGLWEAVFGFTSLVGMLVAARGRTSKLLIGWLAATPLLAFFARYPREQSVITFDRIMVAALVLLFLRDAVNRRAPGGLRVGLFELTWATFCAFVFLDLMFRPGSSVYAWRTGFDGFLLPLVVLVVARQGIEIKSLGRFPVWALSGLAIFLFPIGVYELLTHQDVMAYPGSDLFFDGMVRPNGPFAANHSYALISLIVALLVWHWPTIAGVTESRSQQLLRRGAGLVAVAASALPLFRAVWLTAGLCAVVPAYLGSTRRQRRRLVFLSLAAGVLVLVGGKLVERTSFYQSRVANPENFYTRLATYQAAVNMFEDHWLAGVGLTRYTEEYNRVYYNEDDYNRKYPTVFGEIPRNSPHNNILAVWAELGIIGGSLYVLAHLLLLVEGVLLCRSAEPTARAAGRLLVALWLAYWVPGMVLASGYYADLNLYFFTACGLVLGVKREKSEKAKREIQFAKEEG